jgi:hypothetical protein
MRRRPAVIIYVVQWRPFYNEKPAALSGAAGHYKII